MSAAPMQILFIGLSVTSAWGNGHATTYRALISALAAAGHRVQFFERDQPWYAAHRDLPEPGYCDVILYRDLAALKERADEIAAADAVIVGSYVPDGIEAARIVLRHARGVTAFYDIDTPVTLSGVEAGTCRYLDAAIVPGFDLYLSFTGGPTLERLERDFGARRACALFCSADPSLHRPVDTRQRWDLGYLGTYSSDRQPALDRLLIEPARRMPGRNFVVAGAQYPASIAWPPNVERIDHIPPGEHARFYSSMRWTLNLTRNDMVRLGHSPSVRLFEAAACGVPIVSDSWPGLDEIFTVGREIRVAARSEEIVALLEEPRAEAERVGRAGRRRVVREHTSAHRARDLIDCIRAAVKSPGHSAARGVAISEGKRQEAALGNG